MLPAANFGRGRNKVKFKTWGVYLKGDGEWLRNTLRSSRGAVETHKARVPGSANQALTLQKVSRTKVLISWPLPVSADACARVLKLALGDNWRDFVTDPAGVQGAHDTAATADEGVPSSSAGPSVAGTLTSMTATVVEPKPEAATLDTFCKPNLLPLKLEVITALYLVKDKTR